MAETRIAGLDALRGAALCGMAADHLAWDLNALGWAVPNPAASAAWTVFGDVVAGTFLLVSGIGLQLARSKGPAAALRRLAVLAAAGAAVTGASLWVAPAAPILFGILQCIAVTNALAFATLGLSRTVRLVLAAFAAAAPVLRSEGFDGWTGAVLGLAAIPPQTLDYRPLLPWLGIVLLGTVMGEGMAPRHVPPGRRCRSARPLRWMGRHSLAFYLLHQPVLYGGLLLLGQVLDPLPAGPDPFVRQCRADCTATGAAPRLCAAACTCTAERLAAEAQSGEKRLTPRHLDAIEKNCRDGGGT